MTALDAADLVLIASRTLGISTDAVLAEVNLGSVEAALAEARSAGADLSDPDAAAAAAAGLIHALLRRRPFPRQGQQVAVAAGLQFLSLNGWQADLDPSATAVVVVEALASGQLHPAGAAAWLSLRLTPARDARPTPATRSPGSRTVAGVLLAVAVGGAALLAAACSRAPSVPAAPTSVVHAVSTSMPTASSASVP